MQPAHEAHDCLMNALLVNDSAASASNIWSHEHLGTIRVRFPLIAGVTSNGCGFELLVDMKTLRESHVSMSVCRRATPELMYMAQKVLVTASWCPHVSSWMDHTRPALDRCASKICSTSCHLGSDHQVQCSRLNADRRMEFEHTVDTCLSQKNPSQNACFCSVRMTQYLLHEDSHPLQAISRLFRAV